MPKSHMKMRFKDEGPHTHCDVAYQDSSGRIAAFRGTANRAKITDWVKRAMRTHGPAATAHAMGCAHSADAMAGEIRQEARAQALAAVADLMGWSPFNVIKKVAWDYNPAAYVARKTAGLALNTVKDAGRFAGRAIASPFRRKKSGGGGAPQGGPESPEDAPQDDDSQQEGEDMSGTDDMMGQELAQQYEIAACHGADSLVGDYEIGNGDDMMGDVLGFLPFAAISAYKHRRELAKIAKSGNSRAANAAKTLAKAKGGDHDAKAKIKALDKAAKKGDPRAKDAMKRLHAVNNTAIKNARGPISQLFHEGIT